MSCHGINGAIFVLPLHMYVRCTASCTVHCTLQCRKHYHLNFKIVHRFAKYGWYEGLVVGAKVCKGVQGWCTLMGTKWRLFIAPTARWDHTNIVINLYTTSIIFYNPHELSANYFPAIAQYQGCLPHPVEKQAPPAPQKLTKPAGHNGAKLTEDPTNYAHVIEVAKEAFHLAFCAARGYLVCRKKNK